jgi:hypothetical protein
MKKSTMHSLFGSAIVLIMLTVSISGIFLSCGPAKQSSDDVLQAQQEKLTQEAVAQTGLPAIINFQELKQMKQLYEKRDQANLICYAYVYSEITGKFRFIGKCMGFGLPYGTQFSNPMKTVSTSSSTGYIEQLPQAEPNGLFMPPTADATWVFLLDSLGNPHATYFEPKVTILEFPLPKSVCFND